MSSPRDRDTDELLDELESTLDALRDELDARDGRRSRAPTPAELLRFTERHTIPTVVATLEATVQALELLRELLRLLDPERSTTRADEAGERLGRAGETAAAGAERVLADLRRALAAEELPDDPDARSLVADARELSEEVETRLRQARRGADDGDGGVAIDVSAEDGTEESGKTGDEAEEGDDTGEGVDIDVDAELESLRDEMRGDQDETAR